jgi:glycosyltransferase involved in cell wall biosynthesis
VKRPLISFVLLTYDREQFVREAVKGAFSQTYSPLEIILSDDCSSDSTFNIIEEMSKCYQGPHDTVLNRNSQNLGIGGHVNRVMELARGDLIVVAADDDISVPERVEKIYKVYESTNRAAKSIYSDYSIMDEKGKILDNHGNTLIHGEQLSIQDIVKKESILSGCSHAWSREVFEVFGPVITPLTCEDMVIPIRSALLGKIKYIDEPLVMHRRHGNNAWNYRIIPDAEKEIKFTKFWILEKRAIFRNWIKDLNKMMELFPGKKDELEYLMEIATKRLSDAEDDIFLMDGSCSWIKKWKILCKDMMEGASLKTIRHKIGFNLIPGIYRKYMEVKYRIKAK